MNRPGSGRVAGKVAIVTGGAAGLGLACARRLAEEGACVLIADLDAVGAEAAAREIEAAGGIASAAPVDVSHEDAVVRMVETAIERYGGIDILHNNAAVTDPEHQAADASLLDLDVGVWDRTVAVDLRGAMLGCKHAIPHMIRRGGGSIINTSSNSALAGDLSLAAYAAAKGGLNSLTRSVATAFGKQGIRCNAVSPAHIDSPSLRRNVPSEVVEMLLEECLTPRLGTPEDVAQVVLFLASDESTFMTGQILRVDGGALSHLAHVSKLRETGRTTNRS